MSEKRSTTFRCPKCGGRYFRTANVGAALIEKTEPQRFQCKGHGDGYSCRWEGGGDECLVDLVEQATKDVRRILVEVRGDATSEEYAELSGAVAMLPSRLLAEREANRD